jgi:hypothetical protein
MDEQEFKLALVKAFSDKDVQNILTENIINGLSERQEQARKSRYWEKLMAVIGVIISANISQIIEFVIRHTR